MTIEPQKSNIIEIVIVKPQVQKSLKIVNNPTSISPRVIRKMTRASTTAATVKPKKGGSEEVFEKEEYY